MKPQTPIRILVTIVAGLLSGCASEEFVPRSGNKLYEPISRTTINPHDQVQLNRLAATLAKETNNITIVKDARVVDLTDSQGEFKAISFQYQSDGKYTSMIVPLANTKDAGNGYQLSHESCIMKFSSKQEGHAYEILERCKTLKFEGAGNGTAITFSDKAFEIALVKASESLFRNPAGK